MTTFGRAALSLAFLLALGTPAATQSLNPNPPSSPVRLVFIHHSTGQNWLADWDGTLGLALRDSNYFVSDTNYGWGPDDGEAGGAIGDHTDIGHWYSWFRGPYRTTYLPALYAESGMNSDYSRLATNPGGENRIVLFKSCFPNSALGGNPSDPVPPIGSNPLRGQDSYSEAMTVANAKGIYSDLLAYFATRTDKLFVAVTAPPLVADATDATQAANARAFNDWLVNDWLDGYPHHNVVVFDFFDVLTSNGGSSRTNAPNINDLGWADGNHHRYRNGAVEHMQTVSFNYSAYGSSSSDSHPSRAGNLKATGELVSFLNVAYHCWTGDGACPGAPSETADRYRLYSDITKEHHYTTDAYEYLVLGTRGWIQEGVAHRVYLAATPVSGVTPVPLYRLYHPGIRQHLWTTDRNEYDVLGTRGWIQENVDGYILPSAIAGLTVPLYRLAHVALPLHLWTTDLNEYTVLATRGWAQEGVVGHALP